MVFSFRGGISGVAKVIHENIRIRKDNEFYTTTITISTM